MSPPANVAKLLEAFFIERLAKQRQASPHTIAAYRDTFRLLLSFAQQRLGKAPSSLAVRDLDAPLLGAFLDHLEKHRGNGARTRNARLAAVHSFFRFAAFQEPTESAVIQRVLAMPSKRYKRKLIGFLSEDEVEALLAAPDRSTWTGRRDYALLLLAVQTGLRVSELLSLRRTDFVFGAGAHVRCEGKGRKERCTPLRRGTANLIRRWLRETPAAPDVAVFCSTRGRPLSSDGVQYLLDKHATAAGHACGSLRKKRVSPHLLRHTAAMDLVHHGIDQSVIALWLGHETIETTQVYITADLALKQKALAKTGPKASRPASRFRPDDRLMEFLKGL